MSTRASGEALPSRLRLLTAAVPVAGVLALVSAAALRPRLPGPGLLAAALLLGGAAVAAELRPVRIGAKQKMSLAAVPALTCAFLVPAPVAGLLMTAAAVGGNLGVGRRARATAFNAGTVAIAVTVAALVGGMAADTGPSAVARAALGAALFSLVSILLAAAASAAQRNQPLGATLSAALNDSWPQHGAMDAIAIACAVLLLRAPWAAVLPLAVLPLIYRMNRLIEAELESKERVARLLASQRRFLTDVSHNVGNPLATIRTNLSLLRRPRLPDQTATALADAETEAARLSELFRRLRVLAETDDEVPLRMAPLDLAEMAADLVRAYTGPAVARRVRLDRMVDAPVRVTADEDLLRQAAANLVENAIRYSPEGGAVTIRVGVGGREARLDVIDHGPGIEPDRLPAIFERFQRGPEGGSGLGLAIARSVVERHGGRILVDSDPGTGTRFSIVLPATR